MLNAALLCSQANRSGNHCRIRIYPLSSLLISWIYLRCFAVITAVR